MDKHNIYVGLEEEMSTEEVHPPETSSVSTDTLEVESEPGQMNPKKKSQLKDSNKAGQSRKEGNPEENSRQDSKQKQQDSESK